MDNTFNRGGQAFVQGARELISESLLGCRAQEIDIGHKDVLFAQTFKYRGDQRGFPVAPGRDDQDALAATQVADELFQLAGAIGEVFAGGHVAEAERVATGFVRSS